VLNDITLLSGRGVEPTVSGTQSQRISLCGTATLSGKGQGGEGDPQQGGSVIRLYGVSYWIVQGLTLTNATYGVLNRHSSNNNIYRTLTVHSMGQEGIAIQFESNYNIVEGCTFYNLGTKYPQYGEGVYVATLSVPDDNSDYNQILNNHFGPNVRADHIDVKAGGAHGIIRGNTFDGTGLLGDNHYWIRMIGNGWVVEDNVASIANTHGFSIWFPSTHPGWGESNVFRRNYLDLAGASGYGIVDYGDGPNTIYCDNTAVNAGSGLTNITCTEG